MGSGAGSPTEDPGVVDMGDDGSVDRKLSWPGQVCNVTSCGILCLVMSSLHNL